ncbi:aconitase family-domain-containing protein [Boeremia exigua]|uniref:aconitase family-domain-containing protein n=1 Tax=Boeremia exigua TaxID=749465 RepID=UPI001E8EE694|nr:aconitase family-domain-containing protein [Boeremia exigua]KAH6614872.1 aconitase family-domain-containing protein [Boeremia exigua]
MILASVCTTRAMRSRCTSYPRIPLTRKLATVAPRVPISPLNLDITLDYDRQISQLNAVKHRSRQPLTLTEKIIYSHLYTGPDYAWNLDKIRRGETLLHLRPDRVACHDATATMALLQFISAGLPKVQVPTTVHSDHLVVSRDGADEDLKRGSIEHQEVYAFLSSAAKKYGIGWWKPGAGIIHTTIFENYAFPGGLIIGTDSHTPNAGGMGMLGIGVGGSDAVDAMAGMPWELMSPKVVGVRLTGKLSGWTSTKDIICKLAGILTVSGGKGKVIEFFGTGCGSLGATAMATVCNMSAEIGSTSCIFPYSDSMGRYLSATKRDDIAREANKYKDVLLTADEGSEDRYDDIIEINLDTLEPHVNGPFTPDLSHPVSQLKGAVQKSNWPVNISHSMVGSCTNSSYEDLYKTSQLVGQAKAAGVPRVKTPFMVSPGSEDIRATAEAEGILQALRDAGAVILSTTCGPCVGQWDRTDVDVKGRERNTVVSSFNRNFVARHDGNPETCSFVTSPEMVTAFAYAGRIDFNPISDSIAVDGKASQLRFTAPTSVELPVAFTTGENLYQAPVENAGHLLVNIDPQSDRLQLLRPFDAWKTGSAQDMPVLIKVAGKCTTDHISPAGPWYKYRGHLENISNNMLLAASNAFLPPGDSKLLGYTIHPLDSTTGVIHEVARDLQNRNVKWCIIGDWNYGEGSSREHAALEPRYLGGIAVVARSFARIHETNLKKQGLLPLTFADPADYDRIALGDRVTLVGVESGEMLPGQQVGLRVVTREGGAWEARLDHSYSERQLRWLRAGSALNYIKETILGE